MDNIIEIQGYKFSEETNGRDLRYLPSYEVEEVIPFMKERNIDGISINYAHGFNGKDISFLKYFDFIKRINILSRTIDDISPIHYLHNLHTLIIQTYDKTPINFKVFKSLKHCALFWRDGIDSIFDSPSLEHLSFRYWKKEKDLSKFHQLKSLRFLRIANSRKFESLKGIKELTSLRSLELYYLPNLTSMSPIEKCTSIEDFRIGNCKKITSLESLNKLRNLNFLSLSNMAFIDSIEPLKDLKLIQHLSIYGDTKIKDGDLSIIYKLKNLKRLILTNKRGYSHKRAEIVRDLQIGYRSFV